MTWLFFKSIFLKIATDHVMGAIDIVVCPMTLTDIGVAPISISHECSMQYMLLFIYPPPLYS